MKFERFIKSLSVQDPQLAVLVDPDKYDPEVIRTANRCGVSCFLVGGSFLERGDIAAVVRSIRKLSTLPVILFPGDETQLTRHADGILLPSVISGRNPDYLIGKQVMMAPVIRRMKLPCAPMGYILIEGGRTSATQRVTKTRPLEAAQKQLVCDTALAAQLMGFRAVYLEAGSGANMRVPAALIRAVRRTITIPLIVGGGISTAAQARAIAKAGADLVVVGNALEKDVLLLPKLHTAFK